MSRVGVIASWLHLALVVGLSPGEFAHAEVGSLLPNPRLPDLQGQWHFLLDTNARVNVFLFFHPTKPHSVDTLRKLAGLEKRLADRPIHWAAVVSDRFPASQVQETVKKTGIRMPVLVDRSDALYGRLGVKLYPVVGIADAQGRLKHYLHFRQVNYMAMIEACIQFELGEISREQLDAVLNPGASHAQRSGSPVARRWLHLAQTLFQREQYDRALQAIQQSLKYDDQAAEAHLWHGKILAALKRYDEARTAFQKALQLDADNQDVLQELQKLPDEGGTQAP